MSHHTLHAPWRMDYIRSLETPDASQGGCFLCQAAAALDDAAQRRQRRILWHTPHVIVVMNKYPYTSGHLMVAPRAHKAALEDLSPEELTALQTETVAAIELLKRTIAPQGFNIGINQGRAAGAGVPTHLHQHIVPRWGGDINFISIVGDVRIQPRAMDDIFDELLRNREASAK